MIDRIIRAIKLDASLYREVAHDEKLLTESLLVVAAVALLSALGKLIGASHPLLAFFGEITNSILFGWLLWSIVAYFVGTAFFEGKASVNEMLRALGYANAPRLLSLFGFIPCIGWLIALAGGILSLIAGVVAIRETMGFDNDKAIITAIVGFILYIMSSAAIQILFAGLSLPFRAMF